MKLLLAMTIAWMGNAQSEAEQPVEDAPAAIVESVEAQVEEVQVEEPVMVAQCSCDMEPLMEPVTPNDILCCHQRVMSDLVAGDFAPESPEFFSAMRRADVLVRGIETRMLIIQEEEAVGLDSFSLEELAALLRINLDRILFIISPRIRDVYQRRPEKPETVWTPEQREILANIVKYAESTMRYSYFGARNILMGTLWRRGVEVGGSRLDLKLLMRDMQNNESSGVNVCDTVEITEPTSGDIGFIRADEYLGRALTEAGKHGLGRTNLRVNLLADRARLRVTVTPGYEKEEEFLFGALRDLQDAFRDGLVDGKIRDASNDVYGFALKRLACKYINDKEYEKALQLDAFLDVDYTWSEKSTIYLLLARDAALADGRPIVASQLFAKGYELFLQKLNLGYPDLVEGWPMEFFGKMFGLNYKQLKVKERAVAKKPIFRELVSTHFHLSPYDCHLLREYTKTLKEIPIAETMNRAMSIAVRVMPEVCLFELNTDQQDAGGGK